MAVAYVQFHWKLQLGKAILPTQNGGELALVYSVVFLYIACHGPGTASLDQWRARRRARALPGERDVGANFFKSC